MSDLIEKHDAAEAFITRRKLRLVKVMALSADDGNAAAAKAAWDMLSDLNGQLGIDAALLDALSIEVDREHEWQPEEIFPDD